MKRELNKDKLIELLRKFGKDMRSNRLWPLAVVLLVAIVAVPIVLAKSSPGTPAPTGPEGAAPPSGTAVPALNVQAQSGHSRLPGRGRDPFAGNGSSAPSSTSGSTQATVPSAGAGVTSGSSAVSTVSSAGGASSPSGSTGASSAPPTSTPASPPSITPNKKPTPAPTGLTSTQSYDVALAVTNSSGGLNTLDPLERLTVLPNSTQRMIVELGVLQGGRRVLFAVQPGTVAGGPGVCTPGPIDCEILSLGQDQTESLSINSPSGPVQIALFAVTRITARQYSSRGEADQARRAESQAGRDVLNGDSSTLPALGLFRYDPTVGAVVDLRNLTAQDK